MTSADVREGCFVRAVGLAELGLSFDRLADDGAMVCADLPAALVLADFADGVLTGLAFDGLISGGRAINGTRLIDRLFKRRESRLRRAQTINA